MRHTSVTSYLVSIFFLMLAGPRLAGQDTALIVQLRPGKTPGQILPLEKKADAEPRLLSATLNTYLLPAASLSEAQQYYQLLQHHAAVVHLSFDRTVQFRLTPNDAQYERQWSLPKIQAPETWDLTPGGRTAGGDEIVVAIIDSGFDPLHPDLAPNIWQNRADIPGDGIDNDQNGFVDDQNGWNLVGDRPDQEIDWHGQSVAGIIGARGNNNLGISGVNWEVKLMLFSVQKVSHVIAAFDYALVQRQKYNESRGQTGAFVVAVNTSLGLDLTFCDSQPAWRDIYDVLGAQGVLSVASPSNANVNVDLEGDIPTTCPSDYLLTTLRTDRQDDKHPNSGYGLVSIDLGAPGQNIFTTQLNDSYGDFTGTSAAAPHLTGAIALLYSLPCATLADQALADPAGAAFRVRSALLNGVDPVSSLEAYAATGGRLNVKKSANIIMDNCESKEGAASLLKIWPNPARELLNIKYQLESARSGQLSIYNSLGQQVWRDNIFPTGGLTGNKRVSLPDLTRGFYFIVLRAGERQSVEKLIIK